MRILAGGEREGGAWGPGLAALLAELGMYDEARRELDAIRRRGLSELRTGLWLASLTYLTDAATRSGMTAMAARASTRSSSLTRAGIVTVGHGVACYGSADRYLGHGGRDAGEREPAARHFELAHARSTARMGAAPGSPTPRTSTGGCCCRGGDDPAAARELLARGSDARRADRDADAARRGSRAAGAPVASAAAARTGSRRARSQILRLVAQGLCNREIGERLVISQHTAANHVRSILRKTGCANRTEAAAYAHRHGLAAAVAAGVGCGHAALS